jgi:hypothetical protein
MRAFVLLLAFLVPVAAARKASSNPELGPGEFYLVEAVVPADGVTRFLATAGEPKQRCAFHIVIAKAEPGAGGGETAAATLLRHPHADCTAFLQGLAGEPGFKRPPRRSSTGKITGSLTILGRDQSRSSADGGAPARFSGQPPGPWLAGEMKLAPGGLEVTLNLNSRQGRGELAPKDPAQAGAVVAELAKLLLPDGPPVMGGKAWEDLGKAERKRAMKDVVLPRMAQVFKQLDAERYAKIDCTLCHGQRAKQSNFQMPNPDLPTLDFANKLRKERAEKFQTTRFMFKHVVPEMLLALGVRPFDPKTGQGFGCQSCHPVKN